MRGYTLLEILFALGIGAVLTSMAASSLDGMLTSWRVDAVARKLVLDLRMAQAVAARRNEAMVLRVDLAAPECGGGPRYRLANQDGSFLHETVCVERDYRGIRLGVLDAPAVACPSLALALPDSGCTFCDGAGGSLTILPSGEILSPAGGAAVGLVFTPGRDLEEREPGRARLVVASTGTARTSVLRVWKGAWECP